MKERPIIFSGDMVLAILAGTKTQTRRVMKPQPHEGWQPDYYSDLHKMCDGEFVMKNGEPVPVGYGAVNVDDDCGYVCPFGKPGDRLWVRETWAPRDKCALLEKDRGNIFYRADDKMNYETDGRWKPSIHMPRWASRITLEITGVRVERLQDISAGDCLAEGIEAPDVPFNDWKVCDTLTVINDYKDLWESINGPGSWDKIPWVWVIEFKRIENEQGN